MQGKEFKDNSNNNELEDKLKLFKNTDSSNLIEWFKNLELFLKSKVNIYSEVIETRKVPVEWLEYYIPSEFFFYENNNLRDNNYFVCFCRFITIERITIERHLYVT